MDFFDFFNDRVPLFTFGPVNGVRVCNTGERAIRGNRNHVKVVDFDEFSRFGHGRTGHPGQLFVQLEEVLQGDRRECLGLFLDPHSFFGLDCLV